jgi:single-stranded-DNA-specific exonuclease
MLLLDLALAPGGLTPALVGTMESAGPFGMGWPGPRVAVGPLRLVKADLVGNDHVRLIVRGEDGASLSRPIAFRAADKPDMGQSAARMVRAIASCGWRARAKIDDWGSGLQAELHIEDAAWADCD